MKNRNEENNKNPMTLGIIKKWRNAGNQGPWTSGVNQSCAEKKG